MSHITTEFFCRLKYTLPIVILLLLTILSLGYYVIFYQNITSGWAIYIYITVTILSTAIIYKILYLSVSNHIKLKQAQDKYFSHQSNPSKILKERNESINQQKLISESKSILEHFHSAPNSPISRQNSAPVFDSLSRPHLQNHQHQPGSPFSQHPVQNHSKINPHQDRYQTMPQQYPVNKYQSQPRNSIHQKRLDSIYLIEEEEENHRHSHFRAAREEEDEEEEDDDDAF